MIKDYKASLMRQLASLTDDVKNDLDFSLEFDSGNISKLHSELESKFSAINKNVTNPIK